ncbi:MAG: hypothetical protein ABI806_26890 [Candidatus Solibacter sp.]
MKRSLIILAAVVLSAAAWYALSGHQAPAVQAPLANMDLAAFRGEFNRASDRPRLIVLLSPT